MADVLLVQSYGSFCPGIHTLAEGGEVDFNQPIGDPVQHLESAVESALLKTVPFQTVQQRWPSL